MSEPHDPLEMQKNNPEAIQILVELYTIDYEVATELWHRFIETVKKMRSVAQSNQPSQSRGR